MTDLDRQLWEIDENLCRADLTDLERAEHTAKRARVVKQQKELSAKLANNSKRGPKDKGQAKFVLAKLAKTESEPSKNAEKGQAES